MLFLDFETQDGFMHAGYGMGWPFALKGYINPGFKLLGASVKTDREEVHYFTDLKDLAKVIFASSEICMHNAQYDIGCILVLFKQLGIDYNSWWKEVKFYDTLIMGKLINQSYHSYSLENLAKIYGGKIKGTHIIADYVWNEGLYQIWYSQHYKVDCKCKQTPCPDCKDTKRKPKKCHTRPDNKTLYSWGMSNLEKIPDNIVGDYCNADVEATSDLYYRFQADLATFSDAFDLDRYSDLLKICVEQKARGVRVDVDKAILTRTYLEDKLKEISKEIFDEVGNKFNLNSSDQKAEALRSIGIDDFPRTPTGKDSVNKKWLEKQGHPICKKIVKYSNYEKLSRDFLTKLIDYQEVHKNNGSNDFRIFPTFHILGATATGRFSSGAKARAGKKSYELNMQQIPKRGEDRDASKYVREVFLPEEHEVWVSADFATQEQRLMVDYARQYELKSVNSLLNKLKQDPCSDFHGVVADFCNIDRDSAKAINFGLSYGLGEAGLCRSLNLPTSYVVKYGRKREVAGLQGKIILTKYYKFMSFMKELQDIVSNDLKNNHYVDTIGGRRLFADKPVFKNGEMWNFYYKGLSKLIQGSAADVTKQALINCYKAGLKILLSVHDEICISTVNPERDIPILKQCMENTFKDIDVPMIVDVSKGDSWAE